MAVHAVPKLGRKGLTLEEEKADRKRDAEEHRKAIKALVWSRDEGKCRVCGGLADEMHERVFRSVGGTRSTENSFAVCTWRGNNCHRYLQKHAIEVEGVDANHRLVFRWNREMVRRPPFRIKSKRRSQNREDAA